MTRCFTSHDHVARDFSRIPMFSCVFKIFSRKIKTISLKRTQLCNLLQIALIKCYTLGRIFWLYSWTRFRWNGNVAVAAPDSRCRCFRCRWSVADPYGWILAHCFHSFFHGENRNRLSLPSILHSHPEEYWRWANNSWWDTRHFRTFPDAFIQWLVRYHLLMHTRSACFLTQISWTETCS